MSKLGRIPRCPDEEPCRYPRGRFQLGAGGAVGDALAWGFWGRDHQNRVAGERAWTITQHDHTATSRGQSEHLGKLQRHECQQEEHQHRTLRMSRIKRCQNRRLPGRGDHVARKSTHNRQGSGHNRAERAPPQVRSGLAAGGKRIRTIGPARRKAVVPKREHPRAASRSLPGWPQTISARTTVGQPAIRS
jgi:hypothetical protein